jgi:hypothetical protein
MLPCSGRGRFCRITAIADLVDNGDGTVSDTATGLMGQQAEAGAMNWEVALVYCEKSVLAGCTDWRLPDRNELRAGPIRRIHDDPFWNTSSSLKWSFSSAMTFFFHQLLTVKVHARNLGSPFLSA